MLRENISAAMLMLRKSKENTLDAPEPLDRQLPTYQQQMLDIEAFVISFSEPAPKKEDLDKDNIWPPR